MTQPNKIHFYTHHQPLLSDATHGYLKAILSKHPKFIWVLDQQSSVEKVMNWLWQHPDWLIVDIIDSFHSGIALAWPGAPIPDDLPVINYSALSIESLKNSCKFELVTQENTKEMRQRFLFYRKHNIELEITKPS